MNKSKIIRFGEKYFLKHPFKPTIALMHLTAKSQNQKNGEIKMQLLETFVKQKHGTAYAAAKSTGVDAKQITRWIQYGCMIDKKGVIWKPQGQLYKNLGGTSE